MESRYFKRDISWLSFNDRVLLEAEDDTLPLYERINFISIYSSNLEEFYKIRVADHKAIATGLGVCWGKDKNGELIGGWAAEYVEYFDTFIDDEIARGHAEMWLNKSLQHELDIRGVEKHSDFQLWHNYINITQQFGYSLTALGFLNFEHAEPAKA